MKCNLMKYIIKLILLIILLIILSQGGCDMQIENDYQKTYTETFTRTVGATTRTNARGTLPQPAPSDANAIWLAPNGSDAAAGTQAAPKLTLNGAIAALGAGKTTVHIFRNSYVGDIVINDTTYSTLGVGFNIQVEEGEKATISYTTVSYSPGTNARLVLSGTNIINGIRLYDDNASSTGSHKLLIVNTDTLNVTLDNCQLDVLKANLSGGVYFFSIAFTKNGAGANTGTITLNNCYINSPFGVYLYWTHNITINNTIIHNPLEVNGIDVIAPNGGISILADTTATAGTLTLKNVIFSNYFAKGVDTAYAANRNVNVPSIYIDYNTGGSTSNAYTISMENVHFFSGNNAIVASVLNNLQRLTIVAENCHLMGNSLLSVASSTLTSIDYTNITITNTNPINGETPPMFLDASAATDGDIESHRLQRAGLSVPDGSGKYFIDSPLVGAGKSGADITPFIEAVALASAAYNNTIDIDWPPASMAIENSYANSISLRDVNGNLHRDYDKERRKFVFNFGDNIHLSNIQMKELRQLLSDRGSKKFYPLNIGGNLFQENGVSSGTFSSTDNSIAPSAAIGTPMVIDHWRGFWVTIGSNSYYITSNDNTKLYLVDKLGLGFPSNGGVGFIVDHILVNTEADNYVFKQNNFTQFTKGGFWREVDTDAQPYDYVIDAITLEEIEDNEENI